MNKFDAILAKEITAISKCVIGVIVGVLIVLAAACVFWVLVLCEGCSTSPASYGVPNLHCVDPDKNIWRGGQPTEAGFAYLRSIGVSNVVKLNTMSEGVDMSPAMNVIYDPVTTWQQTFGPVKEQMDIAIASITNGAYVHCEHGVNRTGSAIMGYRVKVQKWTKARAQAEADALGWQTTMPALKEWWERYEP